MTSPSTTINVPVDWRTLNLGAGGRSLIEASAGTGKTWTIAVLYLRLLLESGWSPRQIVVTTFTDAAAQELRERLRRKLEWAWLQATHDDRVPATAAPDETWLRARWTDGGSQRVQDIARLRLALAELDVAPVNTLHGLCRRVLADYPFACGVAFALGDMVAGDSLLEEVSEDLWRRLQQGDGHDQLQVLQRAGGICLSPGSLRSRLRLILAPGVTIDVLAPQAIDRLLPRAWAPRLRALVADDALFTKSCSLRNYWKALADVIDDHAKVPPDHPAVKGLRRATDLSGVSASGKKNAEVIAAAAFSEESADIMHALREQPLRRFWRAVAAVAREQMHARLQARHQLTFDALINTVSDALAREASSGGERPLANALFAAWPVALVDEFQDTDAQQYGLLDAIYRDADGSSRGRLVMIGDPKQAIYRFRGGDIHAYRRAAEQADADGRLTLQTNHRSAPALVAAFNQFYAAAGKVLSDHAEHPIQYLPVYASDRRVCAPYTVGGQACTQPLQFHYLAVAPALASERCATALRVCANQIAAMLQSGDHRIGDKPVQPSDIAVLLPTGRNIADLRDLLALRGVPCVTSANSSVFQTDIARELQVVLYAVAHASDLPALRGAAATRLWGGSFRELQQRADDVAGWQSAAQVFHQWHVTWRERGIQAVVDQLMAHMARRWLRTLGGERALTDLRHLGELLQAQSEIASGTEELLAWFSACREDATAAGEAADAAQLRIESDSARVRLMTLHASKGLEFPIVFLPLMWNHGERPGADLYVTSDDAGRRTVGFSTIDQKCEQLDLQDERFRVLYVALTRAIYTCHVFALQLDRPANARATKRTEGTACSALDVMLERMRPTLLEGAEMSAELREATPQINWIDGWQPGAQHDYRAADTDDANRRARTLPAPRSGPLEARHSFTTLAQGVQHEPIDPGASAGDEGDADLLDAVMDLAESADALATVDPPLPASPSILSAPPHDDLLALATVRGTDIGNAIHAIFEQRAPAVPMTAQRALIEHALDDAGVRRRDIEQSTLVDALARRLQGALEAPLGLADDPTMGLQQLPANDLRAEMEFHFALDRVAMSALQRACAQHGESHLVPRSSRVLSGLMNGKIDLIFQHGGRFHVLDYKGNYLGDHVSDYQGAALRSAMDHSHYRFQALLYAVATDRYLRQRLGAAYHRERHLGECVYLFVRAAGLAPDAGIWRHRFSDALLVAVDRVLGGDDVREAP